MILEELALFLEQRSIGTRGTDLFTGIMPDTPDSAVAVLERGGSHAEYALDKKGINIENPSISVWSRATSYLTARQKSQDALDALVTIANTSLSNVKYLRATPSTSPFLLKRDENDRVDIAFNVSIIKAPS